MHLSTLVNRGHCHKNIFYLHANYFSKVRYDKLCYTRLKADSVQLNLSMKRKMKTEK